MSAYADPGEDLIPAFQQGDSTAFNAFFREHYKPLCFFASQLTGDTAAAEDAVKDSFVKLWDQRANFSHPKSIKSFLYTATRNTCLNLLRHQKVKEHFREEIQYLEGQAADEPVLQEMIRTELMQQIYKEIAQLPEKRQQVFRMVFMEGMSHEEIAERLGISVFTVKEHKAKALAQLRLRFSDRQLVLFILFGGSLFTALR
ncbi:RNA polymerase sigma-70 factor [Chitinophaga deserti]|uniref:RNA polymerase sigma-70 factor n=1 Tax=Chitinophaga deserti TaxID=2164099 RepID=UPI000D6D29DB|nr:RNA polymerase sigma-70 factor [Chitinophaga deserti]